MAQKKIGSVSSSSKNTYARNSALAGQTVSKNGMNVTYNANGYAVSGINYSHPTFSGTSRSIAAPSYDSAMAKVTGDTSRSAYGGSSYDQQYFTTKELQQADYIRQQAAAGKMSWNRANQLVEGIRAKYGYSGGTSGAGYSQLGYGNTTYGGASTSSPLARSGGSGASSAGYGTASSGYSGYSGGSASSYTPTDNSEYLRQLAAAYLKQQQEALTSAYNTNLSSLQAEQDSLASQYDSARNAESASSALARQRFNEAAAAYGLNSGGMGQAALSFANQRQSGLSSLQEAENKANAEAERQRTLLGQQYQSAMNEALAANNQQLYEQLYQEATRVDQAIQAQQQFDAQMALQAYQTQLSQANADREYNLKSSTAAWNQQMQEATQKAQAEALAKEDALASAKLLASGGDYSQYGQLYNWDDATVQKMNQLWQAANQPAAASYSSYSGGSESSSTKSQSSLANDAMQWAALTGGNAEDYVNAYYKDYGFSSATQARSSLNVFNSQNSGAGLSDSGFQQLVMVVSSNLQSGNQNSALQMVDSNWAKMTTAQQSQVRKLLNDFDAYYTP